MRGKFVAQRFESSTLTLCSLLQLCALCSGYMVCVVHRWCLTTRMGALLHEHSNPQRATRSSRVWGPAALSFKESAKNLPKLAFSWYNTEGIWAVPFWSMPSANTGFSSSKTLDTALPREAYCQTTQHSPHQPPWRNLRHHSCDVGAWMETLADSPAASHLCP